MGGLDPGSPGHRKIAGRVGFVLYVLAVCALLGYTLIGAENEPPDWTPTLTHTDERMELQADYPSNWHLQSFNELVGHSDYTGFIISNVKHDFEHPDLGPNTETSAWDMRALPNSAVVVEVSLLAGFAYTRCERGKDESPLDLANFDRDKIQPSYGAPPRLYLAPCIEGAYNFVTHVWLFPDASAEDRKVAETIVESIDQLS